MARDPVVQPPTGELSVPSVPHVWGVKMAFGCQVSWPVQPRGRSSLAKALILYGLLMNSIL